MGRVADYRLQIGFGGEFGAPASGRFTIGTSTIGGGDVIATPFTEFFTGPYDDVTDDVAASVRVVRGRDSRLARMPAGSLETVLCRPDDASFFNPTSAGSPLADGSITPGFVPMRPVRLQASLDDGASWLGVFYGFLRSASYDPLSRRCTIRAEDLFLWLSRVRPVIAATPGLTSMQALGLVLDAIEFTDPALRVLSASPSLTDLTLEADGTADALQLIEGLMAAELGAFFIDRDGRAVGEDRYGRDRRHTPAYAFTDALIEVASRVELDRIRNRAQVTDAGGVPVTKTDTASRRDYGLADADGLSSDYLPEGAGEGIASLILLRLKDSRPPLWATIENDDEATLETQLTLELEQRVAVDEDLAGTDGDYYIDRIEDEIVPGGLHTSRYLLSAASSTSLFEIGRSTIGGEDVFAA